MHRRKRIGRKHCSRACKSRRIDAVVMRNRSRIRPVSYTHLPQGIPHLFVFLFHLLSPSLHLIFKNSDVTLPHYTVFVPTLQLLVQYVQMGQNSMEKSYPELQEILVLKSPSVSTCLINCESVCTLFFKNFETFLQLISVFVQNVDCTNVVVIPSSCYRNSG